jgi:hypothetical protein
MQVFIAWSGDRSRDFALALHVWLKSAIQRLDPWVSERDIEVGQRWTEELAKQIKTAQFAILCLTPENRRSPWINFEAGALAEAVGSNRVIPALVDFRAAELDWPLAQFQAVEATRDGILKMVLSINKALGEQRLDAGMLATVFDGLWPNLEGRIGKILATHGGDFRPKEKSERELIEEILATVRSFSAGAETTGVDRVAALKEQNWEELYVRGVDFANARRGETTDTEALAAYSLAIARMPTALEKNLVARLYTYRGAMFKRLGRLDEAKSDLSFAERFATRETEIVDLLYNQASVAALRGEDDDAVAFLENLFKKSARHRSVVQHNPYFERLSRDPRYMKLVFP